MTGDVFLSNEEYLQQLETIKARQQRIIQVREQSKKMAAEILNRMKIEADRQYQQTENRILSEIRQHYSRELASVRQHYHRCINDINRKHYVNHANVTKNSNETRKQPLKILRNERNTEQVSDKQNSKKPPKNQVKETESNKTAVDSGNTKKTSSYMVSKTSCQKLKKPITEQVPYLPENIIIKPKEVNIKISKDGEQLSAPSPQKKSTNAKKSVISLNKENFDIDKPYSTSPVKRYPAHVKKPTLLNSNKIKTNEVVERQILDDVRGERDGNEIYNQLVHDRIRVLEQKEKILRRQSPSAPSITHSTLINKPARFSEYFSNVRISVTAPKHPAVNDSASENLPKETLKESKGTSVDLDDDVDRVRRKKKLLVLELSNAETQTDVLSNSDSTLNGSDEEVEPLSEFKKSTVRTRKSRSPRKTPCLSPIPKEAENSNRSTMKSKKLTGSENHRRKLLNSNGVTVTVSSNPIGEPTSSTDSTSALANSYPTNSSENNVTRAEHNHSHKTVQVVVNVLSNEIEERKSKFADRQKNVAYVIPENEFRKVPNWRKLFDNEEKMTESSYFSPPEVMLKKQSKVNFKSRSEAVKSATDENEPDLGYYVQKLLLMRPESIENLDVSSCSTVTIDEMIQTSNKPQRKTRMKIPLYQNSFEETKHVKKSNKLPYYQNSFDNTVDTVCELVLKSQGNDTTSSDTCSGDNESTELFSYVNDDQNSSSVSDSSQLPAENVVPRTSILKRPENISKSPQHLSDPRTTHRSVENEHSQDDSGDNQIQLPSVEELCKRGFVSEELLNQKSTDDQETLEEEEFLQHLLSVGQPKVERSRHLDFKSSRHEKVPYDATKPNVFQKLPKHPADEVDAPSIDHKTKSTSDLKNETRLLGWIGATVQRTLQASAINSTSSGDSSDPVRHTYKSLEHLIEEPLDNAENNLFHKHFTLSPIKVPDIHLTISPVLQDGKL